MFTPVVKGREYTPEDAERVQEGARLVNFRTAKEMSWSQCHPHPKSTWPAPWDSMGIQAVYIINLYDRGERRETMAEVIREIGLMDHVTLLQVPRHKDGFLVGCWASHRQIAVHALSHGLQRIVVFEDDLNNFDEGWRSQIPLAAKVLNSKGCERLMLGHCPLPGSWPSKEFGTGVFWGRCLTTHAYVANLSHLERLAAVDPTPKLVNTLAEKYDVRGIDYFLRDSTSKSTFLMMPPFVRQSQFHFSDHEQCVRYSFGSKFVAYQIVFWCAVICVIGLLLVSGLALLAAWSLTRRVVFAPV